jgi:hypothetical protein
VEATAAGDSHQVPRPPTPLPGSSGTPPRRRFPLANPLPWHSPSVDREARLVMQGATSSNRGLRLAFNPPLSLAAPPLPARPARGTHIPAASVLPLCGITPAVVAFPPQMPDGSDSERRNQARSPGRGGCEADVGRDGVPADRADPTQPPALRERAGRNPAERDVAALRRFPGGSARVGCTITIAYVN